MSVLTQNSAAARWDWAGTQFLHTTQTQLTLRPQTLLITCSATCATSSILGEADGEDVVQLRIAANDIPPASASDVRITRTLERAIASGVRDIVVCGHSCCKSVGERLGESQPSRDRTTSVASALKGRPEGFMLGMMRRMQAATTLQSRVCQNVVDQLQNLESYPDIANAVADGSVRLHGWVYLDQSGMILSYDQSRGKFVPLADDSEVPLGLTSREQCNSSL